MTKTTEALKQAEEALHNVQNALLFVSGSVKDYSTSNMAADAHDDAYKALAAILEALAGENNGRTNNTGNEKCHSNFNRDSDLVPLSKKALAEPVKRPQNCGTGYCSCIECVMEPISIPDHVTCPFCESDHVPGWLHDLKLDAKAIRANEREKVMNEPLTKEMWERFRSEVRAEALEEAKEIAKTIGGSFAVEFAAAIRGLK